ncbi:MAG: cytochrome c3 family protein [Anaerolinea sp.]|nr:cytochrome c3 family protein [Anaerolinea sp.]
MKPRRLGCLTGAGLLAAALTLLLVAGLFVLRGGRMFSPGPLHAQTSGAALGGIASHADSGGDCAICHTAPWNPTTMAQRCQECHSDIAADLNDSTTLHGALQAQGAEMDCRQCHTEHRGPTASLTFAAMDNFPHDMVGFSLMGHGLRADGSSFDCQDCHSESLARFDPLTCDDCHRQDDAAFMQAHVADFGTDCLACHDGIDSYARDSFDHSRLAFPLTGQHMEASCGECHANARSTADLQATPTDCVACHVEDDAHDGQFGTDCAACHSTGDWRDASFDHSQTTFPLTGQHTAVACAGCHVDQGFRGTPTTCIACHGEPDFHAAAFALTCADCHTTAAWQPARFDQPHPFPLDHGDGGVNACRTCHVVQVQSYTCYQCHEPGEIAEEHGKEGIADFQDCVSCHPTGTKDEAKGREGDDD